MPTLGAGIITYIKVNFSNAAISALLPKPIIISYDDKWKIQLQSTCNLIYNKNLHRYFWNNDLLNCRNV